MTTMGWKFWRRDEPEAERERPLPDPVEHMRSTDNPRLHALADEIEAGRRRQEWNENRKRMERAQAEHICGRSPGQHGERPAPDPDHPYWRAQDAALLRMMRGCTFGAGLTLPSGRFITGEEAALWQELEDGHDREP